MLEPLFKINIGGLPAVIVNPKRTSVNTFAKDSVQFWMLCRPGAASGSSPTTETALPDLISEV